jgi:hypothetical protein
MGENPPQETRANLVINGDKDADGYHNRSNLQDQGRRSAVKVRKIAEVKGGRKKRPAVRKERPWPAIAKTAG